MWYEKLMCEVGNSTCTRNQHETSDILLPENYLKYLTYYFLEITKNRHPVWEIVHGDTTRNMTHCFMKTLLEFDIKHLTLWRQCFMVILSEFGIKRLTYFIETLPEISIHHLMYLFIPVFGIKTSDVLLDGNSRRIPPKNIIRHTS